MSHGPITQDRECVDEILALDGALGAALVEWTEGTVVAALARDGDEERVRLAALGEAEVLVAKVAAVGADAQGDLIEDIIITLGSEYHVLRLLKSQPRHVLYVNLDRSRANLAHTTMRLAEIEDLLVLEVGTYRAIRRTTGALG